MKWAEFTNVDNISVFLDLKGHAEVSIDAQFEDTHVSVARYIVSAKERTTFLLPVSFLRGNAILGVSVENIPGKLDSDLGCDQLFPLEENGIENREMRDEADFYYVLSIMPCKTQSFTAAAGTFKVMSLRTLCSG